MSLSIGIIGCGNSAKALAYYLSSLKHSVLLYVRNIEKHLHFSKNLTLRAIGKMEGTTKITSVTSDLEYFSKNVSIIFIATQANSYREVAKSFSPYLDVNKHFFVLFSGKLLGCLDFKEGFTHNKEDVKVMETDSIFASRAVEEDSVWIRGIKAWTLFGASTRTETFEYAHVLKYFFPNLEPAQNLIQRGLTDFGALAHAIISLANISRIDRGEEFYFYFEGLSENTICLLEAAEREFSSLAKAYNCELLPMSELLNRYYGCDSSSLLKAIRSVPNYRDSLSPKMLNHRYLQEDVSCTLVPMLELGEKAALELPTLRSVVNICSLLANKDFKSEGRTLRKVQLSHLSAKEIVETLER